MENTRVAVGSLVGAVALHVAMVACGSAGMAPPGDAGVLADVRDALADVARDVIDAETRDAHAGGDGGAACNCVEPPSYTFSGGAVQREGMASQEPAADFSSASVGATTARGDDGSTVVNVATTMHYYLRDGARVIVSCSVLARPDGSVITRPPMRPGGAPYDTRCDQVIYSGAAGSMVSGGAGDGLFLTGARVTGLTNTTITLTLPALAVRLVRSEGGAQAEVGTATVAPITVRGAAPLAQWVTPSRAYRP